MPLLPKQKGYVIAALRRIWRWSLERKEVLKNAESNGKYTCSGCSKQYLRKNVAVDHVIPVVEVSKGFQGWDVYIDRLFCPSGNLQVLCKNKCHKQKTKQEMSDRRKVKRSKVHETL